MMPVDNGRRYRVIRRELRMVHDRNQAASDTPESPVPSVIRIAMRRFLQFFRGAEHTSPAELLHAARVLLWVRWLGLIAALIEIHYRVDHGSLSHTYSTPSTAWGSWRPTGMFSGSYAAGGRSSRPGCWD